MAKSTRSKVKRHFRAKKRESGAYAAVEAARLQRLSAKLTAIRQSDKEGDAEVPRENEDEAMLEGSELSNTEAMKVSPDATTNTSSPKKISTHGPRGSRRESWRASKGLDPHPKSKGMNRQGGIAAKRKAGRSHRRR